MAPALARRGRRARLALIALGAALAGAVVGGAALGAVPIPPGRVAAILLGRLPGLGALVPVTWSEADATIVMVLRLPRVVAAAGAGAALALAGTAFQGLFRNPLADPYIIGASAGAAAGAVAATVLGWRGGVLGLQAVSLFAFAGALGAVVLAYSLARVGGKVPVLSLLLAGIALAAVLGAVVSLLLLSWRAHDLRPVLFWLMGGFGGSHWGALAATAPYAAAGAVLVWRYHRELDAFALGEEGAAQVGVDVEAGKRGVVAGAALLTGAAVATGGIVGFVGLVAPHVMRAVVGPRHRTLLPAAALAGAVLLTLADLAARLSARPAELPVGAVTALLGGPFFLYVLRRYKGRVGGL